jgi:hypothetical protein
VNEHAPQPARSPGEVRIRSNVCGNPNAWHLVPGELLGRCALGPLYIPTHLQQAEKTYYRRCSVCQRNSFEIGKEGCDYGPCRQQGIMAKAAAAAALDVTSGEDGFDQVAEPDDGYEPLPCPPACDISPVETVAGG